MAKISATDANREFSKLLRRANAGETITITSHGRPFASLGPPSAMTATSDEEMRREEARKALFDRISRQPYLHLGRFNRDWAYDD